MNIAAYCRVSTDKDDQLNSLEAQKAFFTEYIKRTGDRLVHLYADEGISGTKIKNRKEFLRMMADAEVGLFDMVIVKDISRFARNTVDLLQNIRKLKGLGIETQFLTANMTSMGNSEFILTIFGALAQEESYNTSKRVKFGKKINAEKGRVPNIVYGYDKTSKDYFNLAINQDEAAVVRDIFKWYTEKGYGATKIANILNERGLKTKRNCEWSQIAVCRILKNELYTGKVINGKQEVQDFLTGQRITKDQSDWMVVSRPSLRIVEDDVFELAQEIIQSRFYSYKKGHERYSNKHLFSKLIRCKECGRAFRRTIRKYKNEYINWVCSTRNQQGVSSCHNAVVIREDDMIDILQNYFQEAIKNKKNIIDRIVAEFNRYYNSNNENIDYEKQLHSELAKLKSTRKKYMDMYMDDLITREELNDRLRGIKTSIEDIEKEVNLISKHISKYELLEQGLNNTFTVIESLADIRSLTNAELRRVVSKIEIDAQKNVEVFLRIPKNIGLKNSVQLGDYCAQSSYQNERFYFIVE